MVSRTVGFLLTFLVVAAFGGAVLWLEGVPTAPSNVCVNAVEDYASLGLKSVPSYADLMMYPNGIEIDPYQLDNSGAKTYSPPQKSSGQTIADPDTSAKALQSRHDYVEANTPQVTQIYYGSITIEQLSGQTVGAYPNALWFTEETQTPTGVPYWITYYYACGS